MISLRYDTKIHKYLVFFALACITDLLFFFSNSNRLILESDVFPFITNSMVWNAIGDLNIILYYLFFINFFNIKKTSFTYYFVQISIVFWIIQIFLELTDFTSFFLIKFAKYYLHSSAIVDFLVLALTSLYIIKNRLKTIDNKIAFIGVAVFTISSFQIALPRIIGLFNSNIGWLNYTFNNIIILQFATMINLLSFITSILYRYVNYEKENYKIKNQLLQKEIERQQSVENERTRIAADMHDELGSGLTKITYLSQLAMSNKDNKDDLTKIKQTSADLVENMSEIIWAMKEENNTLEDLVTYIKSYASEYLDINKIKLTISIPDNYITEIVNGNYRKNIFLCVKESLHNIVKHAKAKSVTITITSNEILHITIQDNGIGLNNLQNETKNKGNGLLNMKLRMEKIGGKMEIIVKNGTCTHFTIPIEKLNH